LLAVDAMPQRRRKRSRVGGGDGNNIAVDDDDVTQPSESDELEDGSNSDGDEILEDEEGDTDDPLNVTVETVQNPTTEDDETGGDDAVDSTGEDRGDDKTHWRGMVWDPEKNCFNYYPCEDVIGGDAEATKEMPEPDQYKKIHPRDRKELRVTFGSARQIMLENLIDSYDAVYKRMETT
jgi:hypothetical protein